MSAGRRGALGVANSKGDSRPGGGVWKRERGDLYRPVEGPWHPGQSKEAGGWLVETGGGGREVRHLPLPLTTLRPEAALYTQVPLEP